MKILSSWTFGSRSGAAYFVRIGCIAVGVLATGCAGVFNPMVKTPPLPGSSIGSATSGSAGVPYSPAPILSPVEVAVVKAAAEALKPSPSGAAEAAAEAAEAVAANVSLADPCKPGELKDIALATAKHAQGIASRIPEFPETITWEYARWAANSVKREIAEKQVDLKRFDFWSGTALLGAGIAGTAVGVFDSSSKATALTAVAIGAGGIVGMRTYVPVAARQEIYSKTVEAITCIEELTANPLSSVLPKPKPAPAWSMLSLIGPSKRIADADLATRRPEVQTGFSLMNTATSETDDIRTRIAAATAAVAAFDSNRPAILLSGVIRAVEVANRQLAKEVLSPDAALAAATNRMATFVKSVQVPITGVGKKLDSAELKSQIGLAMAASVFNVEEVSDANENLEDLKARLAALEAIIALMTDCNASK
jgi:hypothetical protein